jgi:TM2 domain-containing membrane protein YozV
MNQSVKAALLSALVFPGVGQIVSGHIKRGWTFVAIVAVLLVMLISKLMQQALLVLEEMQKKGAAIDINEVSRISAEVVSFSNNLFLNITLSVLIVTWLISIVDAYRVGKK